MTFEDRKKIPSSIPFPGKNRRCRILTLEKVSFRKQRKNRFQTDLRGAEDHSNRQQRKNHTETHKTQRN